MSSVQHRWESGDWTYNTIQGPQPLIDTTLESIQRLPMYSEQPRSDLATARLLLEHNQKPGKSQLLTTSQITM